MFIETSLYNSSMSGSSRIGKYIYSTDSIGHGSYSTVYKGFNTETDQLVAVKIINKQKLSENLKIKIYEEISLLYDFRHPNIITLYDYTEDADNFYMVIEYCAGGDLSEYIRKKHITESLAKNFMCQLISALQYLHSKNIAHRDLKPHNVLLRDGVIKLTDFNFAKELFDNDLAKTLCGSPLYMAPEILNRQDYTNKADLWSLGLILYEMVYGFNPYQDACNILDLTAKIEACPIEYNNKVSDNCNDLLKKLLQKNPVQRINWKDLDKHQWFSSDNPTSTIQIPPKSRPIVINKSNAIDNNLHFTIFDDYTPPKHRYQRSKPIHIRKKSETETRHTPTYFYSAPEPRESGSSVWNYMTSSAALFRGAVSYIASSTPKRY